MEQIIVFGKGNFYKEREKFVNGNYQVWAFIDNQVAEGTENIYHNGIPVYHPNKLLELPEFSILLMAKQFIDMFLQLKELGIQLDRVLFGITIPPYSDVEDILFSEGGYISCKNGNLAYCTCDGERAEFSSWADLVEISKKLVRVKYYRKDTMIKYIAEMPVYPVCRDFGLSRGKAIDRIYIEQFLEANKRFVKGKTIEIAENTYSLKYGEERIEKSYIIHINGWGKDAIKGDLATGEGIPENMFDAAIITQTLMFIYDVESAARNIYKMLKKGGTALITVSGISQISRYDADNWGSFFSFHEEAVKRLFNPIFGEKNVIVNTYGNVKTAIALLYGLCSEELSASDFTVNDEDYPVIISAVLHKE